MKKSEGTQCPKLDENPKKSPTIVTCEVFWCSCISLKSVLVFFIVIPPWVAPGICTNCICWRCCRRLFRRSTKFLASTDCPWFVRLLLRVFWNCCPATSRTRSPNLLVCCSCILVERLGAVLVSSYSSHSSEESGNWAVRYGGGVSIFLGCSSLGAWGISAVLLPQVRRRVGWLFVRLVVVIEVVPQSKLRLELGYQS